MSLFNQTPWRVGPIPARVIERNGQRSYIANVEAPIQLQDAVVKFFPDSPANGPGKGGPVFVFEARYDKEPA